MQGALAGVRIVELAGQGPAPFACAFLADFGADVVLIDRPPGSPLEIPRRFDFYMRNKRSIALDLKSASGLTTAKALIARADVFVEGYRPGVAERLGLGPEDCNTLNPRLVYARMTGWGQSGPMSKEAGHDINYLALSGALGSIGSADAPPPPPLNLVADLGGGAMFLIAGILMALHAAKENGKGQVVDCAMVDGIAQLMSAFQAFRQQGTWSDRREDNIVDGGAPYFRTYATRDGRYVSVGAMESRFYANLVAALGFELRTLPNRDAKENWPQLNRLFEAAFATKSRDEWVEIMRGTDACFAPVLTIDEAWQEPHLTSRGTFAAMDGLNYPAPAPRLSRTPGRLRSPAPAPGADTEGILSDWGVAS